MIVAQSGGPCTQTVSYDGDVDAFANEEESFVFGLGVFWYENPLNAGYTGFPIE